MSYFLAATKICGLITLSEKLIYGKDSYDFDEISSGYMSVARLKIKKKIALPITCNIVLLFQYQTAQNEFKEFERKL